MRRQAEVTISEQSRNVFAWKRRWRRPRIQCGGSCGRAPLGLAQHFRFLGICRPSTIPSDSHAVAGILVAVGASPRCYTQVVTRRRIQGDGANPPSPLGGRAAFKCCVFKRFGSGVAWFVLGLTAVSSRLAFVGLAPAGAQTGRYRRACPRPVPSGHVRRFAADVARRVEIQRRG